MDSQGEIFRLCRLCLVKDQVDIPIFDDPGDERQILLKISSCLPVTVSQDDDLPKKICDICSEKLDSFYEFWNSTASAEKTLRDRLAQEVRQLEPMVPKPIKTLIKEESEVLDEAHAEPVVEEESTKDETEAPPRKRPRRVSAIKAQVSIAAQESDDEEFDTAELVTKVEDGSDEMDIEEKVPNLLELPGTSTDIDQDQAGPSGLGKDGAEAPLNEAVTITNTPPARENTAKSASNHHRENCSKERKIPHYKCVTCKSSFCVPLDIARHIGKGSCIFFCQRCCRYFYNKVTLVGHVVDHDMNKIAEVSDDFENRLLQTSRIIAHDTNENTIGNSKSGQQLTKFGESIPDVISSKNADVSPFINKKNAKRNGTRKNTRLSRTRKKADKKLCDLNNMHCETQQITVPQRGAAETKIQEISPTALHVIEQHNHIVNDEGEKLKPKCGECDLEFNSEDGLESHNVMCHRIVASNQRKKCVKKTLKSNDKEKGSNTLKKSKRRALSSTGVNLSPVVENETLLSANVLINEEVSEGNPKILPVNVSINLQSKSAPDKHVKPVNSTKLTRRQRLAKKDSVNFFTTENKTQGTKLFSETDNGDPKISPVSVSINLQNTPALDKCSKLSNSRKFTRRAKGLDAFSNVDSETQASKLIIEKNVEGDSNKSPASVAINLQDASPLDNYLNLSNSRQLTRRQKNEAKDLVVFGTIDGEKQGNETGEGERKVTSASVPINLQSTSELNQHDNISNPQKLTPRHTDTKKASAVLNTVDSKTQEIPEAQNDTSGAIIEEKVSFEQQNPYNCGEHLLNLSLQETHVKIHTIGKPFSCETCEKSFSQKRALNTHLKYHRKDKPYLCSTCGRQFANLANHKTHLRVHTGEKPFICQSCGKCFSQKSALNTHLKSHTSEKPYNCPYCEKTFAILAFQKNHLRIHTGERPFICQFCGKSFTQKSSLNTHLKSHIKKKPYKCVYCRKRFSTPASKKLHLRIHTGEKPFTCNICEHSFTQKSSLNTHFKNVHSNYQNDIVPLNSEQCTKGVAFKDALNQHLKVHIKEETYECHTCQMHFDQKETLRAHVLTHPNEVLLQVLINPFSIAT